MIVQQLPLHLASQQGLMFVLAVNIYKQFPQLAQSLSRLGYAVDVVAGPATACHDAA